MRSRRAAARARRARRTRARPAGAAPPLARRGRGRAALEHGQEPAAAGGLAPARLRGGPLRSGAWRTLSLCRTSARRLARRQPVGRRRLCPGQHLVSDGRCVADARAIRHDSPAICAGAGRAWPAPEPPALWSGTAAAPSPAPGVSGISNGDACSRDSSAGLRPPRAAWAGSDAGLRPASAPASWLPTQRAATTPPRRARPTRRARRGRPGSARAPRRTAPQWCCRPSRPSPRVASAPLRGSARARRCCQLPASRARPCRQRDMRDPYTSRPLPAQVERLQAHWGQAQLQRRPPGRQQEGIQVSAGRVSTTWLRGGAEDMP